MSTRAGRWFPVSIAAAITRIPARTLSRHCADGVLGDAARRAPSVVRPDEPRSRRGCSHWQISGSWIDAYVESLGDDRGRQVAKVATERRARAV